MHKNQPSLPPSDSTDPKHSANQRFSPLAQEASLSTRGQHLPHLIHNRSSPSLADIGKRGQKSWKHGSQVPQGDDDDLELGRSKTVGSQWSREGPEGTVYGLDGHVPHPPSNFALRKGSVVAVERDSSRKQSTAPSILMTTQMRSQRLIGNSNPRYKWGQYYRSEEQLKEMKKPLRKYHERNNYLIQQYLYIDRLLDSSLPHSLIQEYNEPDVSIPPTIMEDPYADASAETPVTPPSPDGQNPMNGAHTVSTRVKRTPRDIYNLPKDSDENAPLLGKADSNDLDYDEAIEIPAFEPEEGGEDSERIVTVAIYINLAANTILLILKVIVTIMTDSLSVLASLIDSALDFLSTAIVWTTTHLISSADRDQQNYPVGRRRLEPIGVLVFSVIMITSFFQVALSAFNRLSSDDRTIVQLTPAAVAIMGTTVAVKGVCWLWCRLIRNSSVQALAQDAMTDVVFNTFSIIFPLLGYFLHIWWLDPLGGLLLSLYVILSWAATTRTHILNLTGRAASKDERNILLYLTMRFAHTIEKIQGLAAYHAGDKLNVEVDIVLDESMSLRDSHDLGESLQYVLESVPGVERAFVHSDYRSVNLPSHMRQ